MFKVLLSIKEIIFPSVAFISWFKLGLRERYVGKIQWVSLVPENPRDWAESAMSQLEAVIV